MHIYFVRHTELNNPEKIFPFHLPVELSKEGVNHAKKIGEWFEQKNIKNIPIFSSPIKRCVHTSNILASYIDSKVLVDARLIETACPNLQGIKQPKENSWILEEDDPSREPRKTILDRMLSFYNEKITEGKDCIAVSHGDQLTLLWYHLNNQELPKYIWGPDNIENVIHRGDIIDIEIEGGWMKSISRNVA